MRFWLGKLIGFVIGTLLGICIVLVPAVVDRLLHPSYWAGEAHALGQRAGFIYGLLGITVFSLLIGLLFGIIGQAYGGWRQEAAQEKNARLAAVAQAQQTKNVWPPPPNKRDTDDM